MIDYQAYLKIHHYSKIENLNNTQIAQLLEITSETVAKWLACPHYLRVRTL